MATVSGVLVITMHIQFSVLEDASFRQFYQLKGWKEGLVCGCKDIFYRGMFYHTTVIGIGSNETFI
eukprot:13069977-Ditylum_brightwellii.AAC.1